MKLRTICKSKIHHAIVTDADVNYVGSIGIDAKLMRLAGIDRVVDQVADRLFQANWIGHDAGAAVAKQQYFMIAALGSDCGCDQRTDGRRLQLGRALVRAGRKAS